MAKRVPTCGECIHADLCEKDVALPEFSRKNAAHCETFKAAADYVKVVQCKDCKYRSGLNGRPPFMFYVCTCADGLNGAVRENHFCYYGERRNNNEQK